MYYVRIKPIPATKRFETPAEICPSLHAARLLAHRGSELIAAFTSLALARETARVLAVEGLLA
jgi:hypothetical protein